MTTEFGDAECTLNPLPALAARDADIAMLRLVGIPSAVLARIRKGTTLSARLNALEEATKVCQSMENESGIAACQNIEFHLTHATGWLIDPTARAIAGVPVRVEPHWEHVHGAKRETGLSAFEALDATFGRFERVSLAKGDGLYSRDFVKDDDQAFELMHNVWYGKCLVLGETTRCGYTKPRPTLALVRLQKSVRFLDRDETQAAMSKRAGPRIMTFSDPSEMTSFFEVSARKRKAALLSLYAG